ncbi:MAG: hypothetical protein JWO24_3632 [Rhodospirillales bacterium]|nr:hypothetical protein [Rhodospirillales bacterium]
MNSNQTASGDPGAVQTLKGLTPYEAICKAWIAEPRRFTLDHLEPGPAFFSLTGARGGVLASAASAVEAALTAPRWPPGRSRPSGRTCNRRRTYLFLSTSRRISWAITLSLQPTWARDHRRSLSIRPYSDADSSAAPAWRSVPRSRHQAPLRSRRLQPSRRARRSPRGRWTARCTVAPSRCARPAHATWARPRSLRIRQTTTKRATLPRSAPAPGPCRTTRAATWTRQPGGHYWPHASPATRQISRRSRSAARAGWATRSARWR